jgi:hypothetical protein
MGQVFVFRGILFLHGRIFDNFSASVFADLECRVVIGVIPPEADSYHEKKGGKTEI